MWVGSAGEGFYTIGPCGEEAMAAVGLTLRPTDPMALHYRHLASQLARQLKANRPIQEILLDRARGAAVPRTPKPPSTHAGGDAEH